MTIRIHIGAHKTATTEMQQAFRRIRKRLEAMGTGVVGPRGLRGDWISLHRAMFARDEEALGRARTRFGRWLRRYQDHVISEENIIGTVHRRRIFGAGNHFYPEAVENLGLLRDLMGNPEVELFLSIRDPAEFVTSAYGQILREGVAMGIEDYVGDYDVPAFSWVELASRLCAAPGVTRLICWRYEDYATLRPEIMSRLIGPELATLLPPPETHNAGMSEAAYRQFLQWIFDDIDAPFPELLARARTLHPKAPGDPGMRPLPPEVYARSRECYARDVAALAVLDGVTLLRPESGGAGDKPA